MWRAWDGTGRDKEKVARPLGDHCSVISAKPWPQAVTVKTNVGSREFREPRGRIYQSSYTGGLAVANDYEGEGMIPESLFHCFMIIKQILVWAVKVWRVILPVVGKSDKVHVLMEPSSMNDKKFLKLFVRTSWRWKAYVRKDRAERYKGPGCLMGHGAPEPALNTFVKTSCYMWRQAPTWLCSCGQCCAHSIVTV